MLREFRIRPCGEQRGKDLVMSVICCFIEGCATGGITAVDGFRLCRKERRHDFVVAGPRGVVKKSRALSVVLNGSSQGRAAGVEHGMWHAARHKKEFPGLLRAKPCGRRILPCDRTGEPRACRQSVLLAADGVGGGVIVDPPVLATSESNVERITVPVPRVAAAIATEGKA